MKALEVNSINKYFGSNHVLKDVTFSMEKGEVLAIIGSSGGGKTTLLRSLTFLERIQKGSIKISGEIIVAEVECLEKPKKYIVQEWERKEKRSDCNCDSECSLKEAKSDNATALNSDLYTAENSEMISKKCSDINSESGAANAEKSCKICNKIKSICSFKLKKIVKNPITESVATTKSTYPNDDELRLKRLKMGLVFQDFNLFPHKTVIENLILAPMLIKKDIKDENGVVICNESMPEDKARELAMQILEKVGLSDKADSYPCDISGGQKQRVAIARALCMSPDILCFDEPTSALDPELTGEVLKVISNLRDSGVTMLIVTHEIMFAREVADTVIFLDGGRIVEMGEAKSVIDNPQEPRTIEFMDKILKA